jgi:hypothetical protein
MQSFRRKKEDTAPFERESVSSTYEDRLGYIGRMLDEEGCRSVSVVELSGAFILRATAKSNSTVFVSEVVAEDFEGGHVRLPFKPQPSSYEALFRAIGRDQDRRVAANIAIIERKASFEVIGWELGETISKQTYVVFNQLYDRATLQRLAEEQR